MDLVILIKFCEVYLMFRTHFRIVFELFILFDTFLL